MSIDLDALRSAISTGIYSADDSVFSLERDVALSALEQLVAEVERLHAELMTERDAAVTWLQQQATVPGASPDEKRILYWASQRIRKREHLKENK